ncbi:OmpA family protein [Gemmatimonadota bacterium]
MNVSSRTGMALAGLAIVGTGGRGGETAEEALGGTAIASAEAAPPSDEIMTLTAVPSDVGSEEQLPDQVERVDLLTFAQGALFVEQTGLATGSATRALGMIDGDERKLVLTTDGKEPIELIYKMPANTTFDRFAIPNVLETPGNATFFKSVVISGSVEGPDTGYQILATAELETHGPDQQVTELVPQVVTPVRWVKVNLEGGINIVEGDEGRTNLEFTEVVGNGTQDALPLSTAFTGVWDFRLTERMDMKGQPLELHQTGATITGCLSTVVINGTVNGRIARATGFDTSNERPSAFIFVADEDDAIHAVMSVNRGRFGARTAVVDPEVTATACSEAPPEPTFCGLSVYVNFDVNSAVIRPESDQILSDLYAGLVADGVEQVSIEGHTSTEGTEQYNLDLSERRAQAVVDDLVERGFDAGSISAVGKGESEPLLRPDNDESSCSLNRRVEIKCGQEAEADRAALGLTPVTR